MSCNCIIRRTPKTLDEGLVASTDLKLSTYEFPPEGLQKHQDGPLRIYKMEAIYFQIGEYWRKSYIIRNI